MFLVENSKAKTLFFLFFSWGIGGFVLYHPVPFPAMAHDQLQVSKSSHLLKPISKYFKTQYLYTILSGWWFGTFVFFHIWRIIIPTDEFHHFSEG
jgi:hypothetical protein